MQRTVCLDTNIVLWGILGEGKAQDGFKQDCAQYLIQMLENEKVRVVIPTLVLSEATARMEEDDKHEFIKRLCEQVEIIPYCTKSALEYSTIRRIGMKRKNKDFTRKEIIVDSMIVSCCKANGVHQLYTDDSNLKSLASQFMEAPDLPFPPPEQLTLLT